MTRIDALKIACASLLVVAAAACGGNAKSPSVASANGTTTNSSSSSAPPVGKSTSSGGGPARGGSMTMAGGDPAKMRKYASCMRANGVPSFPDPNANGSITINGVNPDSPSFRKAADACKKYTPNGGQPPSPAQQAAMQAQLLKFSACMRAHGLTNFPDPTFSQGRASLRIGRGGQLDPQSPTFQAAQKACQKNLPGIVQSKAGS